LKDGRKIKTVKPLDTSSELFKDEGRVFRIERSSKDGRDNCTQTDTSGQVENTKVIIEESLRNSAKFPRKLARRGPSLSKKHQEAISGRTKRVSREG